METELTSPANFTSPEKEILEANKKDNRGALIQFIRAADLDVRSTNVILKNCSSLEDLNNLNEETLFSYCSKTQLDFGQNLCWPKRSTICVGIDC